MIIFGVACSLLQWRYSSLICFILTFFKVCCAVFVFVCRGLHFFKLFTDCCRSRFA